MRAIFRTLLLAAVVGGASCGFAAASTIDTTGTDIGTIQTFGQPNTATYGQTFIASETELTAFSLYLRERYSGSGTLNVRGYVGAWNGTSVTSILFESSTQTMNAAGTLQEFSFNPNINVVAGNQYVAFLSISNLPAQGESRFGMPNAGDVIPGTFVYMNNGLNESQWTSNGWSNFNGQDAWFKASFTSAVPEPSTWAMLLLGFAGLGFMAYRRQLNSSTLSA